MVGSFRWLIVHASDLYFSRSSGEVDDLLNSATSEEKGASGRTRGVKNDAWKQDKELDQTFEDTGLAEAE